MGRIWHAFSLIGDRLFGRSLVRRLVMAVIFGAPLASVLIGPPWLPTALLIWSPLFALGGGLALVDMHETLNRIEAKRARSAQGG